MITTIKFQESKQSDIDSIINWVFENNSGDRLYDLLKGLDQDSINKVLDKINELSR
jgi:hypothetical protein